MSPTPVIEPASLPLDRGKFTENPQRTRASYDESRRALWVRVREFAVPSGMIEVATARRLVGDWSGACAAARVDVDIDLRSLARTSGRGLAARVRADLRDLAPDLLRWHLPRIAPAGLLRPGLTMVLARYAAEDIGSAVPSDDERLCPSAGAVDLVIRTPPAWAAAGQRIGIALWDRTSPGTGARMHPHPRPNDRYRLDLHRHLWDSRRISALSVLPDAATWVLPDLELLRAGAITADRLHPLVASALGRDRVPTDTSGINAGQQIVECRGERHRIGLVNGVLAALDHDPTEIRREELLAALTGTPMPCLQVIDRSLRQPDWLIGVCERLDHGDIDGALAIVEARLGSDAVLRDGPLRDALETAVRRRITYGLFRAGLPAPGHGHNPPVRRDRGERRAHPRHAASR